MTISIESLLKAYVSLSLLSTVNSRSDDCHLLKKQKSLYDTMIVSQQKSAQTVKHLIAYFVRAIQAKTVIQCLVMNANMSLLMLDI